ncbi:MAG: hypothetical protein M3Q39_03480 [Actinomycetota bacterium]|nr:hypothetical protein [Actinomycetota bacterium]
MIDHAVDLDATDACPLEERCENCAARADLDVATAGSPVGIYCLTLCGHLHRCRHRPRARRLVPSRRSRTRTLPGLPQMMGTRFDECGV